MGRRKIEIQPITHERNRSVTFLKRKNGLFKKAYELGVLCSVDVAVIIFEERPGHHVKLYQYCSGDVHDVVQRHISFKGEKDTRGPSDFSSHGGAASVSRHGRLDDIGEDDEDDEGDDDYQEGSPRQRGIKRRNVGAESHGGRRSDTVELDIFSEPSRSRGVPNLPVPLTGSQSHGTAHLLPPPSHASSFHHSSIPTSSDRHLPPHPPRASLHPVDPRARLAGSQMGIDFDFLNTRSPGGEDPNALRRHRTDSGSSSAIGFVDSRGGGRGGIHPQGRSGSDETSQSTYGYSSAPPVGRPGYGSSAIYAPTPPPFDQRTLSRSSVSDPTSSGANAGYRRISSSAGSPLDVRPGFGNLPNRSSSGSDIFSGLFDSQHPEQPQSSSGGPPMLGSLQSLNTMSNLGGATFGETSSLDWPVHQGSIPGQGVTGPSAAELERTATSAAADASHWLEILAASSGSQPSNKDSLTSTTPIGRTPSAASFGAGGPRDVKMEP